MNGLIGRLLPDGVAAGVGDATPRGGVSAADGVPPVAPGGAQGGGALAGEAFSLLDGGEARGALAKGRLAETPPGLGAAPDTLPRGLAWRPAKGRVSRRAGGSAADSPLEVARGVGVRVMGSCAAGDATAGVRRSGSGVG
jgi:hypothetical protein